MNQGKNNNEPSVKLTIYGKFIDQNFTQLLLNRTDLSLTDIFLLDQIQKKKVIDKKDAQRLKNAKLIEGRFPNWRISAAIASQADKRAEYIRHRTQDDAYYQKLIFDFIEKWGSANRKDIETLLWDKLRDGLNHSQKRNKINNLLSQMREDNQITNEGSRNSPRWKLN